LAGRAAGGQGLAGVVARRGERARLAGGANDFLRCARLCQGGGDVVALARVSADCIGLVLALASRDGGVAIGRGRVPLAGGAGDARLVVAGSRHNEVLAVGAARGGRDGGAARIGIVLGVPARAIDAGGAGTIVSGGSAGPAFASWARGDGVVRAGTGFQRELDPRALRAARCLVRGRSANVARRASARGRGAERGLEARAAVGVGDGVIPRSSAVLVVTGGGGHSILLYTILE